MKQLISLIIAVFCFGQMAWAQPICPLTNKPIVPKEVSSLESFKGIPILHNGRIKPLDTYARSVLLQLSGKSSYEKMPAIHWLARVVFAPVVTQDDKIFLINNPDIAHALRIEEEKYRRYSFNQLKPSLSRLKDLAAAADKIDEKKRDVVENELMRVYQNVLTYSDLSVSFSFAIPDSDFSISDEGTLKTLGINPENKDFSFLDIAIRASQLQKLMAPLENVDSSKWTDAQKKIANVVNNLYSWANTYTHLPLTIIPSYHSHEESWNSPWDAITVDLSLPQSRQEISSLRDMFFAYWDGQQLDFDLAIKAFRQSIEQRVGNHYETSFRNLPLELIFNRLQLFFIAKILYFLTFFLFLCSLINPKKIIYPFGLIFLISGFLCHAPFVRF